jgi:hypothetical protein
MNALSLEIIAAAVGGIAFLLALGLCIRASIRSGGRGSLQLMAMGLFGVIALAMLSILLVPEGTSGNWPGVAATISFACILVLLGLFVYDRVRRTGVPRPSAGRIAVRKVLGLLVYWGICQFLLAALLGLFLIVTPLFVEFPPAERSEMVHGLWIFLVGGIVFLVPPFVGLYFTRRRTDTAHGEPAGGP